MDFSQAGSIPRIIKSWNVILCLQHAALEENYSDESNVILPKRSFAKYVVFFIAVQLAGDNTLDFKSFVISK